MAWFIKRTSYSNTLAHASHKYVDRYKGRDGKWVYVYPDDIEKIKKDNIIGDRRLREIKQNRREAAKTVAAKRLKESVSNGLQKAYARGLENKAAVEERRAAKKELETEEYNKKLQRRTEVTNRLKDSAGRHVIDAYRKYNSKYDETESENRFKKPGENNLSNKAQSIKNRTNDYGEGQKKYKKDSSVSLPTKTSKEYDEEVKENSKRNRFR